MYAEIILETFIYILTFPSDNWGDYMAKIRCIDCGKILERSLKELEATTEWRCVCCCGYWEFIEEELRKKYQRIVWDDKKELKAQTG